MRPSICQRTRYRRDTATAPPAIPASRKVGLATPHLPGHRPRNGEGAMNKNHRRIWTSTTALIGAGMLILTPLHADAANQPSPDGNKRPNPAIVKPSPSHVCPAVDLVPECLPPAGSDSSSAENGSGDLPGHRPVWPATSSGPAMPRITPVTDRSTRSTEPPIGSTTSVVDAFEGPGTASRLARTDRLTPKEPWPPSRSPDRSRSL